MSEQPLWRSVCGLLLLAAVGLASARVASVERVVEPSRFKLDTAEEGPLPLWPAKRPIPIPSSSPNDRSRWATVRALVDDGRFAIGERTRTGPNATDYKDTGILTESGWQSIDVVLHPSRQQFYSSKPPLLAVGLAGEYWLIQKLTGWRIAERPFEVMRIILWTVNVLPLVPYLWFLGRLIGRYGGTDWGRLLVFAAACFGTFITTFAVTLNNHTPAAFCALFALWPLLDVDNAGGWLPAKLAAWRLAVSGFFAGLTACLDLPATALLGGLWLLVFASQPKLTMVTFTPAALLPVAALLTTNYLAIGEFLPAYEKFDTEWYRYPGSHWSNLPPESIDGLAEPKWRYALMLLVGHHGAFSLTPIFLVSLAGIVLLLTRRRPATATPAGPSLPAWVGALALVVSVAVIGFYIVKTNNYGGTTAGPRWLFWLTPLWLVAAIPAADALARSRWGRLAGGLALAVSAFSTAWPVYQVWRHPWAYQLGETLGWWRIG